MPEREIDVQIGRKFPSFLAVALKTPQFLSELQAAGGWRGGAKFDAVTE